MTLDEIRDGYRKHKEEPNALSDFAVEVALWLCSFGDTVAQSEAEEKGAVVAILAEPILTEDGKLKKTSVAEAETTAIVNTKNTYGSNKLYLNSCYKLLDMINSRVMVLMHERNHTK